MTEICLQALRAEPRRIAAVLAHQLPTLPGQPSSRAARRRASAAG
jgi:hypothetical protein